MTAGPLAALAAAVPATAAPASLAAPAAPSQTLTLAPGSEIVSAGSTGFLSVDAQNDVLWTRYADGSTVKLATDSGQFTFTAAHGAASDTVALGDNRFIGISSRITLRDMASGASTVVDLAGYGYDYVGAVGDWVIATKPTGEQGETEEAHVLGLVDGAMTDRVVAGLPDRITDVRAGAGAPGSVLLSYKRVSSGPEVELRDYAVVDLAAAKVTTSRGMVSFGHARSALSATHMASFKNGLGSDYATLSTATLGEDPQTWSMPVSGFYDPMVGLVGDWVLYGDSQDLEHGFDAWETSFRAVPIGGWQSRKILDHATSLAPAPDGSLLVMGGTVEHGEGVYRISAGADGAPVAELIASTGQPTRITLVDTDVPAVARLDQGPGRLRWKLSRLNAHVTVTLRHTASGSERKYYPAVDFPDRDGPGWVDLEWDGLLDGLGGKLAAPDGDYTWQLTAKPINGVGPDLTVRGAFTVSREPAAHDYTGNGSPDLLVRGESGYLFLKDTYHDPANPQLNSRVGDMIGHGWNIYDDVQAVGDVAGATHGDVVGRDRDGVLWLYLGKGDGTFTSRTRIGGGWNGYRQMVGIGDSNVDGRADLLVTAADGSSYVYHGTGNWQVPFAPRELTAIDTPSYQTVI
ncbi:VCBS repeat-containing protein [Streptomyces sp. HNM0663]|uniref:VCBS repeat-containing protein n=1 Tax=Streptomyces chengmaiensis TaxID=3040919 RepID=A0ABT6HFF6_9ACTN|nr:VCBS repeat-containing protein [Streptomyces chengmaiensis]MDH2387495.1 VCBS repeat-containing protein [Streptomyces chengmaiensis]